MPTIAFQVCVFAHKFTGKERDAESGLDYFGARMYASAAGRFMSPDWSSQAEPVPYAKLDNPQSLNLYSYVLNNPLRSIDPDGHLLTNSIGGCAGNASTGASSSECSSTEAQSYKDAAQQQSVPSSTRSYPTVTKAAVAALDAIMATSEKEGAEYGGRIGRRADGKYVYALPTTDHKGAEVDIDGGMKRGTRLPDGTTSAGDYHTHPVSGCPSCPHDQFSGGDNALNVGDRVRSYMESGATRNIYLLDGRKRTSILDGAPTTVIRYGPPQ